MEKSKRVKAFRCGEFDDCIDKAESSLGMPPKKREKYARREDAIIHALELEKQFLEKQYGKVGSSSNHKSSKSSDDVKKELATSAESLRHGNGKCVDQKYHQLSGEVDLPHKGITSAHLQKQEVKEGKQQSGNDVNSDILPRMRGLQDLGLKTASSKRKIPSVDSNGPSKSPLDESSRAPLNGSGASTGNTEDANDKAFSAKRKRSNEGLAGDSIVKRRDKCRPLVQVLESSAMFQVPPSLKPEDSIVSLHAKGEEQTGVEGSTKRSKHVDQTKSIDPTDDYKISPKDIEGSLFKLEDKNNPPADLRRENTSGSTENTETDSSETDSLESDTDEAMADISGTRVTFFSYYNYFPTYVHITIYFILSVYVNVSAYFEFVMLSASTRHVLAFCLILQ